MAALFGTGRTATEPAETMAAMPVYESPGMRQNRAVVARQERPDTPQVGETAEPCQGRCVVRGFEMTEVEGKIRNAAAEPEKANVRSSRHQGRGSVDRQENRCGTILPIFAKKMSVPPDRDETAGWIRQNARQPSFVAAMLFRPIQRAGSIDIGRERRRWR